MPTRARVALLVLTLVAAPSCAVKKPTLKLKTVSVQNVDLEGATLDVVYTLRNPNPVGAKLAHVQYALEVEGHSVVSGKPANGLRVPAKGAADLHFPARIRYLEIFPALKALATKDAARYRASGEIGVGTAIGVVKLPLSHAGTFPVPKLPSFSMEAPSVTNISATGARLVVPLRVSNRNRFPLPLAGFSARIEVAGANVGTASADVPGALAPGQSQVLNLPIDVNFLKVGAAVASALRGGTAPVKLEGALKSGAVSVPVSLSQTVRFR